MSWNYEEGEVVVRLSPRDWQNLEIMLGIALGAAMRGIPILTFESALALINRVNEGNPHYTPYETEGADAIAESIRKVTP